jgi:hypothetical protein
LCIAQNILTADIMSLQSVDEVVVCANIGTPLEAFALMFGMYFLLNISYPASVGASMESSV